MLKGKIKVIDYLIVLFLLLITDSPFFLYISVYVPFLFMIIIWIYALYKKKLRNNKRIIYVFFVVYSLIIIQWVLYSGISPAGLYKPLLIFFTPYIIYRLFGVKYFKYIFDIIYYSSIFTFPIYLLQSMFPPINELVTRAMEFTFQFSWADWPKTLLFYTAPYESGYLLLRNSGIFHEPGAFSLYLMLAIIINTFFTKNPLDRKNVLLAIILLTTFSTAGYILLILFLVYAIPRSKMHPILKFIIFIFMITITVKTYSSKAFLQNKIEENYSTEVNAIKENESGSGRFFAFLKAYEVFKQHILFGKGILEINRPVGKEIDNSGFGWGLMGFFANYGIVFGFIYLLFYYKGIKKLCLFYCLPKGVAILFLIIIHAGLSTQSFFFHASFVMFFIIGLESNTNLDFSIISKRPVVYKTQNYLKSAI